jgi:hypothetical protein
VDQMIGSLYLIGMRMRHLFTRVEVSKGRKQSEIDADKEAAALAAPYRHARLSAVKLAGDSNKAARFKDNATADELRHEIVRRLGHLVPAGLIDLQALPMPDCRIPNQPDTSVD